MGEGLGLSWPKSIEDLYLYRVFKRQCPSCRGQIDDLGNSWMKNQPLYNNIHHLVWRGAIRWTMYIVILFNRSNGTHHKMV